MTRLAESLCSKALGEYKDRGFTAYEKDDHTLVLEHDGQEIKQLNALTVTPTALQDVCHQHLNEDLFKGLNR